MSPVCPVAWPLVGPSRDTCTVVPCGGSGEPYALFCTGAGPQEQAVPSRARCQPRAPEELRAMGKADER